MSWIEVGDFSIDHTLTDSYIVTNERGGGGSLRISSDGHDRRILGGLKFSIRGFFWVRPFCEYILGGLF